ncbi:class I SAM-dependent methyltransferase [Lentzea sp. NPDC051838]|uniref:class I SAM-dependent methyltransferase n=1 Tax=Lentzea sp. NPDC051838 TaxID=3154849 RepID=UPI00344410AB
MPTNSERLAYWNRWHARHGETERSERNEGHADLLAEFVAALEPGPVVELGCGRGLDASAIASAGHVVHGLDVASEAVRRLPANVRGLVHDTAEPLPFGDEEMAGVYSHLALHYFDDRTTRRVFAEIRRITRPGGVLGFAVKSTSDRLWGRGSLVEPDMFDLEGHVRHFFSREYLTDLLTGWHVRFVREYRGCYAGGDQTDSFISAVAVRRPD